VLSIHTNPLFGTGFESFWIGSRLEQVWNLTAKGIQEAHNGYLEVYLNLGFAGLALLAGVIISGYRNTLAVFQRDPYAGRIRLAFFTAGLIYSLTEAGFRMMSVIWIGFLLAVVHVTKEPQPEPEKQFAKSFNKWGVESSIGTEAVVTMGSSLAESEASKGIDSFELNLWLQSIRTRTRER
jgi:O-antigen ligase